MFYATFAKTEYISRMWPCLLRVTSNQCMCVRALSFSARTLKTSGLIFQEVTAPAL